MYSGLSFQMNELIIITAVRSFVLALVGRRILRFVLSGILASISVLTLVLAVILTAVLIVVLAVIVLGHFHFPPKNHCRIVFLFPVQE